MKKTILLVLAFIAICFSANAQKDQGKSKVMQMTYQDFIDQIWDFEKSPNTFVYKGKLPAIVDFNAEWCRPTRFFTSVMEEMAEEYDGKVLFYMVDTERERTLFNILQAKKVPVILLCPMEGQPLMHLGAPKDKEEFKKLIEENLLKQPKAQESMTPVNK